MAKQQKGLIGVLMWLVGVIVSLAVGFGMTSGTLTVPYIPEIIVSIAGWVVVVATLLGVVMAIIGAAK